MSTRKLNEKRRNGKVSAEKEKCGSDVDILHCQILCFEGGADAKFRFVDSDLVSFRVPPYNQMVKKSILLFKCPYCVIEEHLTSVIYSNVTSNG